MIATKKMILAISTAKPANAAKSEHGCNQRDDEKYVKAQPSMAP